MRSRTTSKASGFSRPAAPTCRSSGASWTSYLNESIEQSRGGERARARADGRIPPRAADRRSSRPERAARRGAGGRHLRRHPPAAEDARRAAARRAGRHAARRPRVHLARDFEGAGRHRRRLLTNRARRPAAATRGVATAARSRWPHIATNLTERRGTGNLDPLIGRAEELQRTIEVLCRRRKNNPVFVGEAGVGKTAMAEGLAARLLDSGTIRSRSR